MDVILLGGLCRAIQALASAAPTFLIGLFIAAIFRYYLGTAGTQKLFGGESLRSLPQSWLLGMLLPVCSVGVLPILREMKRAGVRAGAITAFAISAPLFNPLSLLYGLTLSRPAVIIGFAFASLLVVTVLGLIWDSLSKQIAAPEPSDGFKPIGVSRLIACVVADVCGTERSARSRFDDFGGDSHLCDPDVGDESIRDDVCTWKLTWGCIQFVAAGNRRQLCDFDMDREELWP